MANRNVSDFLALDLILVGLLGVWLTISGFQADAGVGGTESPIPLFFAGSLLIFLGLPAVLFAPGYSVVSALFPRGTFSRPGTETGRQISVGERLVLAVGLSVCVVPLLGLGLNFAPGPITQGAFLSAIGLTTVSLTAVAAVRRQLLSPPDRFTLHPLRTAREVTGATKVASRTTLLVVAGLIIVGASIGATAAMTDSGEEFTEFYLTTPDLEQPAGEGGDLPNEIALGGSEEVTVGIGNQEGEETTYTVVVLLQSVRDGEVQEYNRLDTFVVTVPQGETVERPHTISPVMTGEKLRVSYLLYDGPVSADTELSESTAYRHVHIWITVPE